MHSAILIDVKTCSIEGCDRKLAARGWCTMHYNRWVRNGDPGPAESSVIVGLSDRERLERGREIDDETGCWNWAGYHNPSGYGSMTVTLERNKYRCMTCHRISYLEYVGPIPEGMSVHHKCRNRGCFNPEHLALATTMENMLESFENNALKVENRDLKIRVAELEAELAELKRRWR